MATLYEDGHLMVAAIRVLGHQQGKPPSLEDVCGTLARSSEQTHKIARRLHDLGIIEVVEGGYGNRLFVRNHQALEDLPAEASEAPMADALKKFQQERQALSRKVEAIQAEQAAKKKNLFAELEKQIREKAGKTAPEDE